MYNPLNLIPVLFFRPTFNLINATLEPSICHTGCNLVQPLFFDITQGEGDPQDVHHHCCGHMGYLCGVGEGYCLVDTECRGDLTCAENACTWGPGRCCTTNQEISVEFAFTQASGLAVDAIGFGTLLDHGEGGQVESYLS